MAASRPLPFLFLDLNTLNDFFAPGAPLASEGSVLARGNLRDLARAITRAGLLVLAGVDLHAPDDPEFKALKLAPHALDGTDGRRKISETWMRGVPVIPLSGKRRPWPNIVELRQRGGQVILEKNQVDLFSNPATKELMRTFQPRELILYGALLEHEIHATALTARGLGYEVTVAADATGSKDERAAQAVREGLVRRKVKFEPAEEILMRITLWKKREERELHARSGT